MSRDLKDAKPGEVYRDRDGDVWGIMRDGRAVPMFLAEGHFALAVPSDSEDVAKFGPFVRLVPEEREEW